MKKALLFFVKKLRLSNPWNFKAPLLITIPYLLFLLSHLTPIDSFFTIVASITMIVGIAGLGYLSNDLGDREKDAAIQKENATIGLSPLSIALLFGLFLSLAIAPWFYLPFTPNSLCLLCLEFFLFYAYAFKPLRLKERSIFGILADALYAHVVPAILAAYTFYLVVQQQVDSYVLFMMLLAIWQCLLGIRNICFHQVKDHANDVASGTHTFVTGYGLQRITVLIKIVVLPLELIAFLVFVFFISWSFPFLAVLILVYWLYKLWFERNLLRNFSYREWANKFLDDLYNQWLPLALLFLLCARSLSFLPVLVLHVILFRSEAKTRLMYYMQRLIHTGRS